MREQRARESVEVVHPFIILFITYVVHQRSGVNNEGCYNRVEHGAKQPTKRRKVFPFLRRLPLDVCPWAPERRIYSAMTSKHVRVLGSSTGLPKARLLLCCRLRVLKCPGLGEYQYYTGGHNAVADAGKTEQ